MKHYLVQIAEYRPQEFDIEPFDQYLRDRGVRDLATGHGQLFALIHSNEELHRLYIGLAWRLHPDDSVLAIELSADEASAIGLDGQKWVREHEPFGELIRVRDIIGQREKDQCA